MDRAVQQIPECAMVHMVATLRGKSEHGLMMTMCELSLHGFPIPRSPAGMVVHHAWATCIVCYVL